MLIRNITHSTLKEDIFVDHRASKYDMKDHMNISYILCIADRILHSFNFKLHAIEFRLLEVHETRPRGYKTCSCSTQLSKKFILLINVKMPTIVGIFTFISRINTPYESLKARTTYPFQRFSFYEQLKFYAQLS